tara:strand:- start:348 stop:1040 length:693 start_codon:yes stop_codon:yes gene_type:complete
MPDISQQIYAASVLTVTDKSAIVKWSTTKATASKLSCSPLNQSDTVIENSNQNPTIAHQLELTGLSAGVDYVCSISTPDSEEISQIQFSTIIGVDDTPPQILNDRVTTDENGITTVSWFTNEDTFGKVSVSSNMVETEYGKNHEAQFELCVGSHSFNIEATDPSGNTAKKSFEMSVEGDWEKCSQTNKNTDVETQDETSLLSSTTIQIAALFVTLLVILALIRTRRDTFD